MNAPRVNGVVPALTAPRRARRPSVAEAVLGSGLRVIAVRKAGIPMAEVRLRLPALSSRATHPARVNLMADAMLTGAGARNRTDLAAAIQALGADLSVGVDADRLLLSANVLATNLPRLLAVLADVLGGATYPTSEVATERERLVERLTIARSRPTVVAAEELALRMWGGHPYAVDLPRVEAVAAVSAAQVRALHAALVRPHEAVLVIVGDVQPRRVLDQAARELAAWTGTRDPVRVPALPQPGGGPLRVIDRPDSVQSSLRLGRPALRRQDERYPALQLANLIFGGYFSSRWTENIREDKGYTYGPHSRIDHHVLGSVLQLDVEVATEVTAPSWLETAYELGRLATLPVTQQELDSVRQYAVGTLSLSIATQAGLASTLSSLAGAGLDLDWVLTHPARLAAVTVEDVREVAAQFFAPGGFTAVVVGDAAAITTPLARLTSLDT
ncbi:MAG: insulinase family protein [Jatrophihabitans sp.]|nr:MAG: insulinase family protein [Jatrophihabitans sp.]